MLGEILSENPHDYATTDASHQPEIQLTENLLIEENAVPTAHQMKMARLNMECSNKSMQENCVEGQKWHCINEDGRWRKHKCKFYVSVLVFILLMPWHV